MNNYIKYIMLSVYILVMCVNVLAQKTLIDYFLPMEPQSPLVSKNVWGEIVPRDTANGLEDADMSDWCYWDGSIVKDDEGKYHMYASRWSQGYHHSTAWKNHSKGTHAVSDNMFGPYKDLGMTWPYWWGGRGSNVIGLRMHDGRYALVTSEITQGEIFIGDNPYGPFEFQGEIQIDYNGFERGSAQYNFAPNRMSNVMVVLRPDGRYMIVPRQCSSLISDYGIMGPYKIMHGAAWADLEGVPQEKMEDPTIWYSDGLYHIVVNYHGEDKSFHLTSRDGIHHWKNRGLAVNKRQGLFRYTDGTVNDWETVQRPTVYLEDGVIKCFNFSVIDVHKGMDGANDNHGSKVIVVPFDGVGFGKAMSEIIRKEDSIVDSTPVPEPWQSADIGTVTIAGAANLNTEDDVFKLRSAGKNINGTNDNFSFMYQQKTGDFAITAQVMMQDFTDSLAKAGVMIRESLSTDSKNAFIAITPRKGGCFQFRNSASGQTDSVKIEGLRAPYWVRLVKTGNAISASVSSSNKVNWLDVGSTTLDVNNEYYIGLALCSNADNTINITRFQEVDITSSESLDLITSHNFPTVIPASQKPVLKIGYAASTDRKINLVLRDVNDWKNLAWSKQISVNGWGTKTVEVVPNRPLSTTTQYQWEIDMRDNTGHWTTSIDGTSVKVVAILEKPKPEKLTISSQSLALNVNKKVQLTAVATPAISEDVKLIWTSTNKEVAQVDYYLGDVYGIKEGTAEIVVTHSDSGVTDTCTVQVTNPLGINTPSKRNFKIYPNPFTDELIIENGGMAFDGIEIIDLSGRLVFKQLLIGKEKERICLDLNIRIGSMLIVKLFGKEGIEVQKIIYR